MGKLSNINDFIKKAKLIHGDNYDYSQVEYVNNNIKVKIICPTHGEFEQLPRSHTSGTGCRLCKFDSYISNNDEFIIKSNKIYGNKYDYSLINYLGAHRQLIIICKTHGEFSQTPCHHLKGHGCKICNFDDNNEKYSISFIKKSKLIHNNKYNYSSVNYIRTDVKVDIICSIHGIFKTTPSNHIKGKGCPICKESKGELAIREHLIINSIDFTRQKRYTNCRDIKPLPFDFYLPELNTCIEFQGRQHYEPVSYFGGEERFKEQQKRDKIKMEYCKNNNIPLLIIKYDEDITKILNNHFTG